MNIDNDVRLGNYVRGCSGTIIKLDFVGYSFFKSSPKLYQPIILNGDLADLLGCNNGELLFQAHTYQLSELFYKGELWGNIEYLHQYQNAYEDILNKQFNVNEDAMVNYFINNIKSPN